MVRNSTIVNAIIGAVVGVVLSVIPFSTVLGGAVAGFLEGPDERAGAIVGALAGLITFLPVAGGLLLLFGFLGLGLGFGVPAEGIAFVTFLLVASIPFLLFYFVGPSLLGGYLGAYLAREYPERRRRTRDTIGFDTTSEHPSRTVETVSTRDRDRDTMSSGDRDVRDDRSPPGGLEGDGDSERGQGRDRERDPESNR
ncbi:DUF5518 domain-containing protein [Natrinema salaciae]|uniref:DUF5518 domain-containing protein n=1 Tax=Natrinema salaciae TaxID=1186196 RepID=A0A1H9IWS2_9EURY|nr:DUF5518 domain-containing protein [Natrinema salaciae]SEQ78845.1 hypothetical protein SAMN04489841_2354 [Natrinema salaciae]